MIKRLLMNTSSNLILMFVKLVITFIMTPIFIKNLGNYDYGIWGIMASIVGYMGILDLGIKPAIIRFSAKYKEEKETHKLQVMFSSAFAFTMSVGFILCIILISWGVFFPESLSSDSSDFEKYTLVLIILGMQMLIVFPGYVPESYLEGFQLYHLKNKVTLFNSIVGATVLFIFITPNNALYLLALVNAVGFSTKYLIYFYIVSLNKYGALLPNVSDFSIKELAKMLRFGGKSFVQGLAFRIESVTDVLVIGYFLGPAMVPFYSIPANLVSHLRHIGYTLTLALMPQLSELLARKDNLAISNLYVNASKWVIIIMFPLCSLAVIFGPAFIDLWIGKEFGENSQIILLLLVLFTLIPLLDPIQARYLTAINKHGILAKLFPISAFINISISIALVDTYGIYGVAFGSVVPVFIFMPIYLTYCCKNLQISVLNYLRRAVFPSLLPNIALIIISVIIVSDISHYYELIGLCTFSLSIYILLVWTLSLESTDRTKILNFILRRR
jgi:O-antigen/teichoic acid export membrane protein